MELIDGADLVAVEGEDADPVLLEDPAGRRDDDDADGEDGIIVPSVRDDEARERFPGGWTTAKPYLCVLPQPARKG